MAFRWWGSFVFIALMGILYFQNHIEIYLSNPAVAESSPLPQEAQLPSESVQEISQVAAETELNGDTVKPMSPEQFMTSIQTLGSCLKIPLSQRAPPNAIQLDYLLQSIQDTLGVSIAENTDSESIDIQLANGEFRRIVIESVYGEDTIDRKMNYFSVKANGESTPLPLSEDQSLNPTDSLIASLESDGVVQSRNIIRRKYYSNGEELRYIEHSGQLAEFQIWRNGQSYSCDKMLTSQFHCQCN